MHNLWNKQRFHKLLSLETGFPANKKQFYKLTLYLKVNQTCHCYNIIIEVIGATPIEGVRSQSSNVFVLIVFDSELFSPKI